MPTLNLTAREAILVDKALWMLIATDEDEEVQSLQPVRDKLARIECVAAAQNQVDRSRAIESDESTTRGDADASSRKQPPSLLKRGSAPFPTEEP